MTLIVPLPLPTVVSSECVYLIILFLFVLCYICHTVVFPVEDTGGSGRQASEREAFDARNILKVRGNSLLPALLNTAELQTFRLVLTT